MTRRAAALLWLVLGIAVWNGFFDLHVSRGAREYLLLQAEHELGRREARSMIDVMAEAKRRGAVAASLWAGLIVAAGWASLALPAVSRRRRGTPGP